MVEHGVHAWDVSALVPFRACAQALDAAHHVHPFTDTAARLNSGDGSPCHEADCHGCGVDVLGHDGADILGQSKALRP